MRLSNHISRLAHCIKDLADLEEKAQQYYQDFLKSKDFKKLNKEMIEKYPDYNNEQAPMAAEFMMTHVRKILEKAGFTGQCMA